MAFLRHWVNGNTVSLYELRDSIVLGRARHCHIQLDDGTVSAEHVSIIPQGNHYEVKDLDSTNGVLVNGEKITSATLHPGDIIRVGTHELEFLRDLPNDMDKTQKIKKSWIPGLYYTSK